MLLAIDIGNTNTVFGLDDGSGKWKYLWRISTVRSGLAADWAPVIRVLAERDGVLLSNISSCCICSVVPMATVALTEYSKNWVGVEPLLVSSGLNLNVQLAMDEPQEVGADRIANAVAARSFTTGPAIVVDLGTATKIEAISADGTFLGGAISIGLGVSMDALASRAARLFNTELTIPVRPIGTNTAEALRSGIVLGHRHLINGLILDFKKTVGTDAMLFFTGGHAQQLGADFLPGSRFAPDLTLDGIRQIHRLNTVDPHGA